jgi:signal transduction histidine kinase
MAASLKHRLDDQRALLLAISHELRSPLTRARVNAELVPEGPERAALLRDLGEMRDLIGDLLETERLAAGATALRREPVDFDALVGEVVAAHPQGAGVELRLSAGGTPRALDRARVRLLVRNLLDNALRHGGGATRPPLLATEADGGVLLLSVRDFGPGVPDEQLARLGEAFYRPDEARTRAAGGVGLGLFLCRRVVAAHGGTLGFANAGPGLRVTATLPD